MSSNLKVNSLVPATGTEIGIGTTGGSIDFRCAATFGGNVTIGGTLTYDEVINIDSIGIVTARSGVIIPDNKALSLGNRVVGSTAGDLRLYHDGSNSYIDEIGSGNLYIRNASDTAIFCQTDGTVKLHYDGSEKLATTSTGVSVTGTVVASGAATLGNGSGLNWGDTSARIRGESGSSGLLRFDTNGGERLRITSDGKVGINDNNPANQLVVKAPGGSGHTVASVMSGDATTRGTMQAVQGTEGRMGMATNHPLAIYSGGLEKLRIDSTGDMGLGTNTIENFGGGHVTLEVAGSTTSQGGVFKTATSDSAGTGSSGTEMIMFTDNTKGAINVVSSDPLTFSTANVERLRITSDGVVSWRSSSTPLSGTSNTYSVNIYRDSGGGYGYLDCVTGSSNHTGWYMRAYHNGNYNKVIAHNTSNATWFETSGTERLRITSDGNVQINQDSKFLQIGVGQDLDLHHNGTNSYIRNKTGDLHIRPLVNEEGIILKPNGAVELYHNNTKGFETQSGGTKTTGYHTVSTFLYCNEILSITGTNDDQTSHVSISARNAAGGYGNYFIVGTSGNTYFGAGANNYSSNPSGNNINGGTTIRVYGGISSNAYQDAHRFGRDTDGSIIIFQSAGGTEGSIAISGSTTNYNTSSDYRLKENIVNITDGITRLKQLKPRRFNFIKDPSITKDGFIAHEVDSIVSEAVTGTKDETFSKDDEENNIKAGDPKYQQMDASKLIPLLTAALQEAITEIETLKIKVAALEGS